MTNNNQDFLTDYFEFRSYSYQYDRIYWISFNEKNVKENKTGL